MAAATGGGSAARGLRVAILTRSARDKGGDTPAWGLGVDARIVEQALREMNAGGHVRIDTIDHFDPTSFVGSPRKPRPVDVNIHLEVPCRTAWSWAKANLVVVNPEWWPRHAWDWVTAAPEAGGADLFLFKTAYARSLFPEVEGRRARVMTWRAGPELQTVLASLSATTAATSKEFLYLVGASANKLAAAKIVVRAWRAEWPHLRLVGTAKVLDLLRADFDVLPGNVTLQTPFSSEAERLAAQAAAPFHVVASVAEGYGFTFSEAVSLGAIPLWTGLPVYKELWESVVGSVGCIGVTAPSTETPVYRDVPVTFSVADVEAAMSGLLALSDDEVARLRGAMRHAAATRIREFRHGWRTVMSAVVHRIRSSSATTAFAPPRPLAAAALPHVAVVTLTRNRPRWFANMARNILLSDYPKDKLTWIVVDDGDPSAGGRVDDAIARFQSMNPSIGCRYVSLTKQMTIGAKRNRGCEAAPASATVFLMMDDDDHYPAGSIAARVAWLTASGKGCVYCATLPMYDCKRYISAINVPPLDLAPEERVSEASLAFTRNFWEARKFPASVMIAEGEGFLSGRVSETVEIPPEGILVSFLHGANATSRRVPESSEPNGCHYGFEDEFFAYISGLAT